MTRQSSGLTKVFILLGLFIGLGCATFLGVGIYAYRYYVKQQGDDPAILAAERAAQRIEVAEAFRDPSPPTESEAKEFTAFFDHFFDTLHKQPAQAMDDGFDCGRMIVELERNGFLEKFDLKTRMTYSRASVIQGAIIGMRLNAALYAEAFDYDATKIRRVRISTDGKEAVVIAAHTNSKAEDDYPEKIRWWFVRSGKSWKIYDFEFIGSGIRMSSDTARVFSTQLIGKKAQMMAANNAAMAMGRAINAGDIENAETQLNILRGLDLTLMHVMFRNLGEGQIAILKGQPERSLPFFDLVEKDYPDMPLVKVWRARALYDLKRYDDSIASSRQFMNLVGPDCQAYLLEGHALLDLNKNDEAIESYWNALKDNPNEKEAFECLLSCLPKKRRVELIDNILASRNAPDRFQNLFNRFFYQDTEFAESLCKAYCKSRPYDSSGMFATARLLAKEGKVKEGLKVFRQSYEHDDVKNQKYNISIFIYSFPLSFSFLELYEPLADLDRRFVFRNLTYRLGSVFDEEESTASRPKRDEKKQKQLEELISLHAKADPEDPWIDYQHGLLAEGKKDLEKADRFFLAAEKKLPAIKKLIAEEKRERKEFDSGDEFTVRNARISNWYRRGKGVDAFVEFGADEELFSELAYRYQNDSNAEGLSQLLAVYERNHKDDVSIPFWHAEVAWIKKDYETTVGHCRNYFRIWSKLPDEEQEMKYEHSAADRLVRSLIRLKKEAEAEAMFVKYGKDQQNLKILIAASRGNIEKVMSEMKANMETQFGSNDWLYEDEDLGPLLKSAPFKAVREKYPEPKPEKSPETEPKSLAKPATNEEKPVSPKSR